VNGVPVSAGQLRELGALLLDIHGQNDADNCWMNAASGLSGFLRCGERLPGELRRKYHAYRALCAEAERLRLDDSQKLQLEDTLRFPDPGAGKAEIRPGEEAELAERRDLLHNAEKLTEQL
jgi:DNA repair protein RecN (Recombination protein N)